MSAIDLVDLAIEQSASLLKQGNPEASFQVIFRLLDKYPDDIRVINFFVQALLAEKKFDEAFEKIQLALVNYPDNFDLLVNLANCYALTSKFEQAYEKLRVMQEEFDDDPKKLLIIGNLQVSLMDLEGAWHTIKRLLDVYRFFSGVHNLLSRYYIQQGEYKKAYTSLATEIEHNKPELAHFCQLLELCFSSDYRHKAQEHIDQIEMIRGGEDVFSGLSLAYGYAFLGDYEKAHSILDNLSIQSDQLNHEDLVIKLVNLHIMLVQYEKAVYIGVDFLSNNSDSLSLQLLVIELGIKLNLNAVTQIIESALVGCGLKSEVSPQLYDLKFHYLMFQGHYSEALYYRFEIFKKVNNNHEKILKPNEPIRGKKILIIYSGGLEYINLMTVLKQEGAQVKLCCSDQVYTQVSGLIKQFERFDEQLDFKVLTDQVDAWISDFCLPHIIIPAIRSIDDISCMSNQSQATILDNCQLMMAVINDQNVMAKDAFLEEDVNDLETYLAAFNRINVVMYKDFPVQLNQTSQVLITNQVNLAKYAAYLGLQVFFFLTFDKSLPFFDHKKHDIWFDNLRIIRQDLNIGWKLAIQEFKKEFESFVKLKIKV